MELGRKFSPSVLFQTWNEVYFEAQQTISGGTEMAPHISIITGVDFCIGSFIIKSSSFNYRQTDPWVMKADRRNFNFKKNIPEIIA